MKTSELTGAALDWAVAKCEGRDCYCDSEGIWFRDSATHPDGIGTDYGGWELCGPIIERESITITPCEDMESWAADMTFKQGVETKFGPTPLIAAMRCYVASKLGDEVEIPEELC
jgi:hypothetical protein